MSQMLEKLQKAGNDITEYLNRFDQDEETCEMLTSMFVSDTQYSQYMECLRAGNYAECREHIHNVKGTTANIGLTLLSRKAYEIMHCIDEGDFDRLDALNDELSELYNSTMEILKA